MAPGKLLARGAAVVLGLAAAELAVRGWHAAGGGPPEGPAAALRRTLAEVEGTAFDEHTTAPDEEGEVPMLHPFFGWGGNRVDQRMAGLARSFEGDDGGRVDLVIAGGSVAAKFLRHCSEDLIELVSADPRFAGREVRVLNLSSGALKQPQHLIKLAVALGLGWRPDAVILIDGYNELVFPAQNALQDVEPFYPAFGHWGPLLGELTGGPGFCRARFEVELERERAAALAARLERWGLDHSALVSQLAWLRMESIAADHRAARERLVAAAASGSTPIPDARGLEPFDERLLEEAARVWAEGSRSMNALCAARGIAFVHVLQPARDDPGAKPLTAEERASDEAPAAWVWAVREGYPRLRAAGAALRDEGVPLVDASRAFEGVEETLYLDRCHLNARGNALLRNRVVPALLAELR